MSLLLGVQLYDARGDAGRRQSAAVDALRSLASARGDVEAVNLQWTDEAFDVPGLPTLAALRMDSRTVSGRGGARKPIVSEMVDVLAAQAERTGRRWVGVLNGDIQVTPAAVDRIVRHARQGYAFSRMDFDPATGADLGMVTAGLDLFVYDAAWWRANRSRFRAYVAGEPAWDNVFAAVLLAHSDGEIVNREGLIRHERHAPGDWRASPLRDYTHLLGSLDSAYFTMWAHYHAGLEALRADGRPEDGAAERELRERAFRYAPTVRERVVQHARNARARLRYALRSARGR